MTFEPESIETITFDSFTTIVDVLASTERALVGYIDDPEPIMNLWRTRAVDYRMVSNFTDTYEPYDQTTREALEYALDRYEIELSAGEIDEISSVFHELEVFDDVREGMKRLYDAGYPLYIVSNGNSELLDTMVSRANIGDLIEDIISADKIHTYKPDAEIYQYAAEQTEIPLENIAHVATPWYDIYGAIAAGMQGVWVNRKDDPWEAFDGEPDLVVEDLYEFAEALNT
jgi:2-haloacid dehalogenase